MTDDEFLEIFEALSDENKAILIEEADRLLTEQLRESA